MDLLKLEKISMKAFLFTQRFIHHVPDNVTVKNCKIHLNFQALWNAIININDWADFCLILFNLDYFINFIYSYHFFSRKLMWLKTCETIYKHYNIILFMISNYMIFIY